MAGLRPYLEEKNASATAAKKLLLINAGMEKAAARIVPRFRLELEAQDLVPEALAALTAVEEALTLEEDDEKAIDQLQGKIQAAKPSIQAILTLEKNLAAQRYRTPDPEHVQARDIATRFATAESAAGRLRSSPSSTPAPTNQEGPRALDVTQYVSDLFSGEAPRPGGTGRSGEQNGGTPRRPFGRRRGPPPTFSTG
jgi:hypothetical protein